MTTLVIETRVTGTADREDRDTMLDVIGKENVRRAALDPPGEVLPSSTVAEQRASYGIIMSVTANDIHRHNISQSGELTIKEFRDKFTQFSDADRAAIKTITDKYS